MRMKCKYYTILCCCMLSSILLSAQSNNIVRQWRIAGTIPATTEFQGGKGLAGPVAGVHANTMFLAGGANFPDKMPWEGGKKQYYHHGYIFSKAASTLVPSVSGFELPESIAYAANCSTPLGVFYAGGENEQGILKHAYLLRWESKLQKVSITSLPDLPIALTNASATSYKNIVFVVGGESSTGVSDQAWCLDLDQYKAGWQPLPRLPKPISHAVFIATPSSHAYNLYVFGGRCKQADGISEIYNSVYALHTADKTWRALTPLPYALSAGTGVAVGADRVLLFGGERGTVFNQVERYLVEISKATDPAQKDRLVQQKNLLQSTHPGFSKEILLYDLVQQTIQSQGSIPYDVPVTTTAFWWKDAVIIPSGEIKAGIRTPHILSVTIQHRTP